MHEAPSISAAAISLVKRRAIKAHIRLNIISKDTAVTLNVELELLATRVFSNLLHVAEIWALKKEDDRQLLAIFYALLGE